MVGVAKMPAYAGNQPIGIQRGVEVGLWFWLLRRKQRILERRKLGPTHFQEQKEL